MPVMLYYGMRECYPDTHRHVARSLGVFEHVRFCLIKGIIQS